MAYTNLTSLYQTSVATYPDNPLFGLRQSDGTWNWVTYADFGDLVDSARGGLASLGITAGDRVAIISDNRVEWAAGAYATYGLQAAWVPMYEAQQPKEWKYILGDSGAKVVIVAGDNIREKVDLIRPDLPAVEQIVVIGDQAGGDAITWDELVARGAANPVEPVDPPGSDLAGLIYTSGTTGNPKGVMLSHDNLASNVSAVMEVFPLDPEDRSCSFLPWAHSFGQTIELHTLVAFGASSALSGAKTLMRDMPEVQPTILISVPTVFNKIYDGLHKMMDAKGGASKAIFNRALANAGSAQTSPRAERPPAGWRSSTASTTSWCSPRCAMPWAATSNTHSPARRSHCGIYPDVRRQHQPDEEHTAAFRHYGIVL